MTDGSSPELLGVVAAVPGLSAVEINHPQHLRVLDEYEVVAIVRGSGLVPTALSLRFDDPAFAQGAHSRARRRRRASGRSGWPRMPSSWRGDLACRTSTFWMATDGFDYPFVVDYAHRSWRSRASRRVAAHDPGIRVSVEYKPLEPRRCR